MICVLCGGLRLFVFELVEVMVLRVRWLVVVLRVLGFVSRCW